jgi:Domain of unknown function (DUF4136)
MEVPMRRFLRLTVACAMLLPAAALTACATMNVSSQVQRGLNISHYHTYDWGSPDAFPVGDSRLETPFFRDHLEGAVEKALAARGFERAAVSEKADLLFHYHASVNERIDVSRTDRGVRDTYEGADGVTVTSFEAGTIVLDGGDARTDRVIWRGWAQRNLQGVIDNPDRLAKMIDEAVSRMMARFPRPL